MTDSWGRSIQFTYNAQGRVQTMTDPDGKVYSYAYNANGDVSSVTYPDDTVRAYHYEDANVPRFLTGITDENGDRYATWSYDASGKAKSSEHGTSGADRVDLTFNPDGTTTAADANGGSRTYTFQTVGGARKLASLTQPCPTCGPVSSSETYDAYGFVASRTDFNGVTTTYVHNSRGLEESRTEAVGTPEQRTLTTQWHSTFRVPLQVDEPGRRTTYTYDANGNRLTQTVTDTATNESRATTWTYNGLGQVLTMNGPLAGNVDLTTYTYDAAGNLASITNALGHQTLMTSYDAHGNPLTIVDANGVTTTLTHDLRQRLKTRTVAGATTTFDYDGAGQLLKITQPDGAYLQYTYDDAHRLTDIQDNLGNRIHYTLDALGNRIKEEVFDPANALRRAQSQVFNALGQLEQIRNAAGAVVTEYDYDAQGNRVQQTDAGTFTTAFVPDALDRVTEVTDAANGVTEYGYNARDQLTSITDAKGLTTSYTVNAFGDVLVQASPDTGTTSHTYDAAGNRKTQLDARGVSVSYSYDALNRLTFVDYPGTAEDVTYSYDGTNYFGSVPNGVGRLTGIADASGTTTLTYHPRGTLKSETRVILGTTYVITYDYDAADRLTRVEYPSGRVITLTRNALGQVTRVTSTQGTTVEVLADSIQYLPYGPATAWTLGNGIPVTRSFDQDYRIDALTAGAVQGLSYDVDLRGNITALDNLLDATRSQTFTYDSLSRLAGASGVYGSRSWTYDGVGNRLSETRGGTTDTYSYPPTNHRLDSINGGSSVSFAYDAAGNATQKGSDTLSYNSAGRLAAVSRNGQTVGTYTHNASGQRVIKTAGGTATVYHYDQDGQLIAETTASGTVLTEYAHLDGMPLAYFASATSGTSVGGLLGDLLPATTTLTTNYFHLDHLGTPQHVTDASGDIVWSADQEPFGQATPAITSTLTQNLRFPGQYFDAETGLHQNWFRDYDPTTGRYLQADPIGVEDGPSVFGYALQNPLRYTDFFGLHHDGTPCRTPGECRCVTAECAAGLPPLPPTDPCVDSCVAAVTSGKVAAKALCKKIPHPVGRLVCRAAVRLDAENYCRQDCAEKRKRADEGGTCTADNPNGLPR